MKVRELIEALSKLDPEMQVGYENRCADDGREFMEITEAQASSEIGYWAGYHKPANLPVAGAVVLS